MIDRMIRAARLDSNAYEEVEADENATVQAAIIVILASLAAGIGLAEEGIGYILLGVAAALLGWVASAAIIYFVGTRLFATEATSSSVGELLRTLGFAQTPGILRILNFIPVVGLIISLGVFIWIILTTVVAIRQALDFSTARAIGTALVAVLVQFVIAVIIALIVG